MAVEVAVAGMVGSFDRGCLLSCSSAEESMVGRERVGWIDMSQL